MNTTTILNPHLISRMAKRAVAGEPNSLTPEELRHDELLRFENRERYCAQSAASHDGHVAELPARSQLRLTA
jgi:hypothetical protein